MGEIIGILVQKRSSLGFDVRDSPSRMKQSGLEIRKKDFMKKGNSLKQERMV